MKRSLDETVSARPEPVLNDNNPHQCSDEQQNILNAVMAGSRNVLFTGVAGTGKSFTLSKIRQFLERSLSAEQYAFGAPTGTAAVNIEGTTIHSIVGCGVPTTMGDFLNVLTRAIPRKKIKALKVLVFDELSMVPASFLDAIEWVFRAIRESAQVFGGVQLVFCGDFAQLGPIEDNAGHDQMKPNQTVWNGEEISHVDRQTRFANRGYAFQAQCWTKAQFLVLPLTKVFRQADQTFARLLSEVRLGVVTPEAEHVFGELCAVPFENRPQPPRAPQQQQQQQPDQELKAELIEPTKLFAKNHKVNSLNLSRLAELDPSTEHVFDAEDDVVLFRKSDKKSFYTNHTFFKECRVEKQVKLRLGAQVMLLVNADIRTGSQAKLSLCNGSRGVVIGFRALSAVERLEAQEEQSSDLLQKNFKQAQEYPVVRFLNGIERVVYQVPFKYKIPGAAELVRTQVPLKLAWALSIHKSQGATLDRAKVDLSEVFACGQGYCGLSRVKDLAGLLIIGFDKTKFEVDKRVLQFYDQNCSTDGIPLWCDESQKD